MQAHKAAPLSWASRIYTPRQFLKTICSDFLRFHGILWTLCVVGVSVVGMSVIFETAMALLDLKNSVGATAHTFLSICVFASFLANSVNIADVFVECEI